MKLQICFSKHMPKVCAYLVMLAHVVTACELRDSKKVNIFLGKIVASTVL